MANTITKYVTISGILYKIEEYTYRGYADSIHIGNTMTKVPEYEIEKIERMVAETNEKIKKRKY